MSLGAPRAETPAAHDRFLALQIAKGEAAAPRMLYRYGVPFMETAWHASANGMMDVNVGIVAKKVFFLGMTESMRPSAWSDPRNYECLAAGMKLRWRDIRLGPFDRKPSAENVLINGRSPENASIVQSGDSWWVGFKAAVVSARAAHGK
jgi:hypothetical protein